MKPIARYAEGYFNILNIYAVDHSGPDDKVLVGRDCPGRQNRKRWHKVYYTARGKAFIKKNNRRYYLEDFIRVDGPWLAMGDTLVR